MTTLLDLVWYGALAVIAIWVALGVWGAWRMGADDE